MGVKLLRDAITISRGFHIFRHRYGSGHGSGRSDDHARRNGTMNATTVQPWCDEVVNISGQVPPNAPPQVTRIINHGRYYVRSLPHCTEIKIWHHSLAKLLTPYCAIGLMHTHGSALHPAVHNLSGCLSRVTLADLEPWTCDKCYLVKYQRLGALMLRLLARLAYNHSDADPDA